jgi:hypothetical protein
MKLTLSCQRAFSPALRAAACAAVGVFFLMTLAGQKAVAQGVPGTPVRVYTQQPGGRPGLGQQDETPDAPSVEHEKRLRALNAERQKSLVSDTGKLLKLMQELNSEVAAGNADELTPAQLRKVAEIEKLAHSVKDKMSTSVRGVAAYPMPGPLVP